jgi:glycerol uptake facilitator protein
VRAYDEENQHVEHVGLWTVFGSEVTGTAILILLGVGVVANISLTKSYGNGPNWLLVCFGWGLAVFAGVYAAASSGAHLNPAVTVGLWVSGADQYAPGVDITAGSTLVYFAGELIGAFLGAVLAWAAYRKHYDQPHEPGAALGTFATGPAIASTVDNLVTEIIGTFVLIYIILRFGDTPSEIGPLAVALLVIAIGASLGGPTGYAINPARDLGPRIAHAILPIRGKGGSNWRYAWVPVAGPLAGAVLAGAFSHVSL